MSNEFYIPFPGRTLPGLLNPMSRRSYMYKIGQLYAKNEFTADKLQDAFNTLLFFTHAEYCKEQGIESTFSEKEIAELVSLHGNDPNVFDVLKQIGLRYTELEEQEPTVIRDLFI